MNRSPRPLILISGEKTETLTLLEYIFEAEGFRTYLATDGHMLIDLAREQSPQLIVLSSTESLLPTLTACRHLRQAPDTREIPIIIISDTNNAVDATKFGANDYLTRPILPKKLVARVHMLLTENDDGRDERLRFGSIGMDLRTYRVQCGSRDVHLAPIEFRLLRHLLQHPGKIFSRTQLARAVWPPSAYVGPRAVDVHIGRLRKALDSRDAVDPIRTVRSVGYGLHDPQSRYN